MPRTRRRRRGRPSAIAKLTVADLMAEVERRRSMVGSLAALRDKLTTQLESINAVIDELESLVGNVDGVAPLRGPGRPKGSGRGRKRRGRGRGRGRGRRGNEQSLASVLQSVLRGKTMNVADMADAAIKAGYKSTSKNFKTVVGLTLLKSKRMFRRVSRGQYTAK